MSSDAARHALEAVAEQIDHRQPDACQSTPRRRVLEPGQGRLRHQIMTALGQTTTGQLERRIEAQHVEVVAILIAAGDGEHARPVHVGVAVRRACPIARVGQARGKADPFLNLTNYQYAGIRRQPAAVETGAYFFVLNGRQSREIGGSLVHGEPDFPVALRPWPDTKIIRNLNR